MSKTLLAELIRYPHCGIDEWRYHACGRHESRKEYVSAMLLRRDALSQGLLAAEPVT